MRSSIATTGFSGCLNARILFAFVPILLSFSCSADSGDKTSDVAALDQVGTELGVLDSVDEGDLGRSELLSDVEEEAPSDALPFLPPDKVFETRYVAGAASRVINPDHTHAYMGGFGICAGKPEACKYSEGVHDDLKVQAAAIADVHTGEVVIFVGVDAVGLLRPDVDEVHERATEAFKSTFGVQFDGRRVVVGCSHTHSGPDTIGIWGPMLLEERDEEAYISQVKQAILDAAVEAFGNLEDAELDHVYAGTAANYGDDLYANDEDIFGLRARRLNGEAIFHLVRWASHPTLFGYDNKGLSADYVGTLRKRIEDQAGGVAVYFNGPIGSIYPTEVEGCAEPDAFPEGYQDPMNPPDMASQVACVGYRVADLVLEGLAATPVPLAETGLRFRFDQFWFHPTNILLAMLLNTGPFAIEVPDTQDPESRMMAQYSWITLGDLDIVTHPGESFPHFSLHTKEVLAAAGIESPWIFGVSQDYLGYLMSEEQYAGENLSYYRTLSPGELVEPAFLVALQQLLEAKALAQ